MGEDVTQWVCMTEPACFCADELDTYTCDCAVVLTEERCSNCGAPMAEINADTGVEVSR